MTPESLLKSKYPGELVDALLQAYKEIESNFVLRKWKASELDAGHFVEAARRIIESELTGKFTPISQKLNNFSEAVLKSYEQASGDESLRILIPRVLKAIYNIRNKRGVGHIGSVSPNEMDSTLILYSTKWVLAEFIRLASGIASDKAQAIVDKVIERRIELIWKHGDITRILAEKLKAEEKIIVLLFDESPQMDEKLLAIIEYSNVTTFNKILKRLHSDRLIEFSQNGNCQITPKGMIAAESIIAKINKSHL